MTELKRTSEDLKNHAARIIKDFLGNFILNSEIAKNHINKINIEDVKSVDIRIFKLLEIINKELMKNQGWKYRDLMLSFDNEVLILAGELVKNSCSAGLVSSRIDLFNNEIAKLKTLAYLENERANIINNEGYIVSADTTAFANKLNNFAQKNRSEDNTVEDLKNVLVQMLDDIDNPDTQEEIRYGVGDKTISGGELITIGANSGAGKTALAVASATEVAQQGKGILMFNIEMTNKQLAQRITARLARTSVQRLKHFIDLEDHEQAKLHDAFKAINKLNISMSKETSLSINLVSQRIREWYDDQKIKGEKPTAVYIDYLQLMEMPKAERLDVSIGEITAQLKALALELNITIFILSQLNRENLKTKRKPDVADLKNSGNIGHDSDVVIMIHRDDDDETQGQLAELLIRKNRNGETGSVLNDFINGHFYAKND